MIDFRCHFILKIHFLTEVSILLSVWTVIMAIDSRFVINQLKSIPDILSPIIIKKYFRYKLTTEFSTRKAFSLCTSGELLNFLS